MTLSLSNHLAADFAARALRRDVYDGLTQTPKSLPPKWFYDSVGSDLFDQITRLPEYYPTRAEAEILRDRSAEIAAASGADTLVELGSGTSEKTRLLLSALRDSGSLRRFIPFDVDAGVLQAASSAILDEYPGVEIDAVCGDFEEHLGKIPRVGRRLVVFLGLHDRQSDAGAAGRLLVGAFRHLATGRQPAAGHGLGQGHRPAGPRL